MFDLPPIFKLIQEEYLNFFFVIVSKNPGGKLGENISQSRLDLLSSYCERD